MNAIDIHAQGALHRRGSWSSATSGRTRLARAAIWTAAMLVCLAIPSLARAANHEWCVKYKIDSPDRGIGNYGTAQQWIGRGVKVLVWTGNPSSPYQYFNADRETGRFEFSSPWVWGMSAWVIHESTIGSSSNPVRVVVQTPLGGPSPITEFSATIDPDWDSTAAKWRATLQVDSGADHWEEALAIPAYTIHSILNNGSFPGSFESPYRVAELSSAGNNASADAYYLYAGSPFRSEKFLLAHEVGHSASFTLGGPNYTGVDTWSQFYDGSEPLLKQECRWDEGGATNRTRGHAMRSQESQGTGFNEGFAHFIAAMIWNSASSSNAAFRYYKTAPSYGYYSETYQLTAPDQWPLSWNLNAAGCDCSNLNRMNCSGSSSELDWLRGLWSWRTSAGTKPTLSQIFITYDKMARTCTGTNHSNTSIVFRAAAYAVSYTQGQRWDGVRQPFGVDTSPTGGGVTCP